jgi:hypothetical protein
MEFPIDPHNILAVGKEKNIRIEKDFDSLKNVASVFKMIPDFDKNNEYISRDFYGDIVSINVPKAQFDAYKMAVTNKKNIPMMHSMFIFPVLLEIFQTLLNNDDWEIYEDLRWFQAIKKRMKDFNLELNQSNLESENVFELAQKLIDSPLIQSIDNLADALFFKEGENNED